MACAVKTEAIDEHLHFTLRAAAAAAAVGWQHSILRDALCCNVRFVDIYFLCWSAQPFPSGRLRDETFTLVAAAALLDPFPTLHTYLLDVREEFLLIFPF